MGKWWSVLFGVVMLACFLLFAIAPFVGWWLPEGVSTHAAKVDFLFYVILWITAFFFILTQGLLVYFMWAYAAAPGKPLPPEKGLPASAQALAGIAKLVPSFLHDQHRIEMAWTIVPAIILLYIAFAQISTWAEAKYLSRSPEFIGQELPLPIAVSARQFEWRIRYPSVKRFDEWAENASDRSKLDYKSFGRFPQADDVLTVNELHTWVNQPVMVYLSTRDVIHSFNLPHFRVKQDALPGRQIPVWFVPTKSNTKWDEKTGAYIHGWNHETGMADRSLAWDLPCAELCGWGHYRMIGNVYVHKDRAEFMSWLSKAQAFSHQKTADR